MDRLVIGHGYLGSRLSARWRDRGHRVFATTRSAAQGQELPRLGLLPVVCDVSNPDTLTNLPAVEAALFAQEAQDVAPGGTRRQRFEVQQRHEGPGMGPPLAA